MALTQTQITTLKTRLEEQREKLQGVLRSLQAGDPASDTTRLNDNADLGAEAAESSELVAYESLERETQIMLDRVLAALARIDAGTYGITDDGAAIPYERLQVDPTATTIVKSDQ